MPAVATAPLSDAEIERRLPKIQDLIEDERGPGAATKRLVRNGVPPLHAGQLVQAAMRGIRRDIRRAHMPRFLASLGMVAIFLLSLLTGRIFVWLGVLAILAAINALYSLVQMVFAVGYRVDDG